MRDQQKLIDMSCMVLLVFLVKIAFNTGIWRFTSQSANNNIIYLRDLIYGSLFNCDTSVSTAIGSFVVA